MEITFNKIYVIESLGDHETKTGTNLHNDIIRRKLWKQPSIQSEIVIVSSKAELFNFFESVKNQMNQDRVIPYLHFEIHGNPNGFNLKSNEQVNWSELQHRLIELNTIVGNRIWLSLATCYGAFIYSIIKPWDRSPFYGFIGSWKEIDTYDLQASFERFFDTLLENFDIHKAVNLLNLANPNLPVEYKLIASQDVFGRVYAQYDDAFDNSDKFEKRVNKLADDAIERMGKTQNKATFLEQVRIMLIATRDEYKQRFRTRFFMLDLFPENEGRFF